MHAKASSRNFQSTWAQPEGFDSMGIASGFRASTHQVMTSPVILMPPRLLPKDTQICNPC